MEEKWRGKLPVAFTIAIATRKKCVRRKNRVEQSKQGQINQINHTKHWIIQTIVTALTTRHHHRSPETQKLLQKH